MRINGIIVVMLLFVVAVFGLAGCGGGSSSTTSAETKASLLTSAVWYFDNSAPDFLNNGSTCLLNVQLYYSESIASDEIDSFSITAPNGWHWTIASPNIPFNNSSNGKPIIGASMSYGENPHLFPLAGNWTAMIKLKTGETSSIQRSLNEPGNSSEATHLYLYTKEDWAPPSTNSSQYIAALGRFPSQGYTVQYTSTDGGSITTTGFSATMSSFLAAEPNAYNLSCWLYDANKNYLGYTNPEYSTLDHSRTNLVTALGELSITPAATISSAGIIDLKTVRYIRIVYLDGAQYAPSSYSNMGYRSISELIAVH
jgi:hypothetical protein